MTNKTTLHVVKYTDMPIGRNSKDGPKNGVDYCNNHLKPALEEYEYVTVDFNGTLGTTPSFLEELFGGLIRSRYISGDEMLRRVTIIYKYDSVINNIKEYIEEASRKLK